MALLTAPVTTSALPIQPLSTNNDLILNENTNVFQSQIPIESVTSLPLNIAAEESSNRHQRRSLRRILRFV
uniref:Uncharacterized protein n=1 Tax=Panagrolaimus sp. ES5 TaxID=591445 RepID=A0AC34FD73_9BILA